MTYAEFFPLYEHFADQQFKPLNEDELADLEAAWTGAKVGNA